MYSTNKYTLYVGIIHINTHNICRYNTYNLNTCLVLVVHGIYTVQIYNMYINMHINKCSTSNSRCGAGNSDLI